MPHKFLQTVPDLSQVPEVFHPFYTKGDAGFTMRPDVYEHVNTEGLSSALEKERKSASTYEKELKGWKSLGYEAPEKVLEDIKTLKEEAAKKGQSADAFEKYKGEVAQTHAKDLQAKDQQLEAMKNSMFSHMVESEATRLLSDAKGSPALLMPHIASRAKVVEENGKFVVRVVDKDGDVQYNTQTGAPKSLSDLITELKAHPEYGKAFEASKIQGSGTPPGAGNRQPGRQDVSSMSSVDKIKAGLGQLSR